MALKYKALHMLRYYGFLKQLSSSTGQEIPEFLRPQKPSGFLLKYC